MFPGHWVSVAVQGIRKGAFLLQNERKAKNMKKVFISQPMNGKTDEAIKEERQNIVDAVVREYGKDVEIIDSFFEAAPHNAKPLWFLGESLKLLSTADCCFFADGWEKARGCKLEHDAAQAYGIEIIHD